MSLSTFFSNFLPSAACDAPEEKEEEKPEEQSEEKEESGEEKEEPEAEEEEEEEELQDVRVSALCHRFSKNMADTLSMVDFFVPT